MTEETEVYPECVFNKKVGGATREMCKSIREAGARAHVCDTCKCPFKAETEQARDPFELVVPDPLPQGLGRYI